MPQINRIRVNNVKYNFGTQFYDDFMMRFSCRNSIYDLANGGGKSVLMLLLLQNLIPNCTLDDKQPVEKLFRTPGVNTVIHSLIEWKLDACDVRDGYRYMTTGFCARKGKDNSEDSQRELASIEYFNYCIFYKEFGDNDIKNLPLSNGSERVTYNGLKAYLRDLEKHDYGVEVHIFERKGDYQNFISNYGLHESQWEIIRGINKTEGHVRTYFENSYKTTRKVVEDLLIEEIIEKSYNNRIRNGEADDDEMARTLLDIKDKLIELAKRRGEIAGYDRQMELLDEFAGGLGTIGELYDRKERTADGLVGCLMACRRELAGKKEQLENLENTYASLDEEYDVASAGAARAEIEEEYNELNELNSLIEETIAARNAISDRSAGFKEQIRLNDIALEYRDYTDAGAEYDKLKELIANRSKDDEEIIESMHRLAALKYRFYTEKRALNLEGLNRAEETAADIKSEYEAEKEKVRTLFAGMSSEKGIYDEVNSICLSKESSLMAGLKECSLIVADALGQAYEDNGNDIDKSRENIASLDENTAKCAGIIRDNEKKAAVARNRYERMKADYDKAATRYEAAVKRTGHISTLCNIYNCSRDALIHTMHQIYDSTLKQQIEKENEINSLQAYLGNIKEHKVPDYDSRFETVLDYLRGRYGNAVRAGRDAGVDMIREYPYLPYVIVAGDAYDAIAADKVIYSMNTGTYMVPIIRNEMDFPDTGSMNAAYKRMDFLWDEAALAAETDNVSEELKTAKESLVSIRDKAEVIRDDIVTARTVLEDEPAEIIKSELGQIEEDMAQLQDEIELCNRTISNETVRNEALKKALAAEKEHLDECMARRKMLEDNLAIYAELIGLRERRKKVRAEMDKARAEYDIAARNEENLSVKLENAVNNRDRIRADIDREDEVYNSIYRPYYRENDDAANPEGMFEEAVDARFAALQELITGRNGDIEDKTRLMNNCRAAMDKSERSIKRNGMSLEDAKENLEKGLLVIRDEAYIENLRREINDSDRKAAAKDSEIDAQSASRNRIEGSIEHARRVYEEKYGTFERMSDDNPKESIAVFRHKMSEITSRRSDIKSQIRQLENDNRDAMVMERDLERIVTNAGLSGRETANGILTADVSSYDELRKEYNRVLKEEDRLKTDFYNRKQKLITSLEDLKAYELAQEIMASVELPQCVADVTAMVDGLKQTNECIALERDRIDKSLGEMEHIKDRFEDRCIQICSNIRTELDRLPKLSRITLDDEVIPIITLSVPYIREDMYKDRMSVYINETVSAAETFHSPEDKLKYIKGRLSWKRLFSVVVQDMNSIKLSLYKREHIKDQSRYLRYEEAVGSTGQSQGIYIQFLIAIINYIACLNSANKDSQITGNTIFIDNPFGAAKDVYIWEPIFGMLKTNHVQLIVPARGATPAITRMFDVNYILGQKLVAGRQQTVVVDYRSQVKADEMEYVQLDYEQSTIEDFFNT